MSLDSPSSIIARSFHKRIRTDRLRGCGKSFLPSKKVREEGGVLMYEDEAVFCQSGSIYRHWARRGIGSEVKSLPSRKSVKVTRTVAVGTDPKWHFRFTTVFNSDSFLLLLRQLVRQYRGRRIYLVVDSAKYHKTPEVMDWVEENSAKIELHYLPTYSPELNAAEYVWKKTRRKSSYNRFFPTVEHLRQNLFRRFKRFQGNPAWLRNVLASFA
jgi:transposase